MTITVEDLKTMIAAGWVPLRNHGVPDSITLRWTTKHTTPDLPKGRGGWNGPTYDTHTFLTYTVRDGRVRGQVLHGDGRAPWVGRTDSWVSQRRSLEIAAQAQARVSDAPDTTTALPVPACPCECRSGGWCGGCGHAGCGRRTSA